MKELANDYTLTIEPQLPFVYLPPSVFTSFVDAVNEKTKGKYNDPVCDVSKNACKFPVSCDKVPNS